MLEPWNDLANVVPQQKAVKQTQYSVQVNLVPPGFTSADKRKASGQGVLKENNGQFSGDCRVQIGEKVNKKLVPKKRAK